MFKIREAIVVEGRYDKNTLSQVVDTLILETSGFGIFKNPEQMALLRRAAEKRGLIVLTDSDGAGFVIRNRIKSAIAPELVKHAYIPDIYGKEKRKSSPSKEGKLGVEGMRPEIILQALRRAGVQVDRESAAPRAAIGKADLYALGLSGGRDSARLRQKLLKAMDLPEHLTANGLLEVLNIITDRDELAQLISQIQE